MQKLHWDNGHLACEDKVSLVCSAGGIANACMISPVLETENIRGEWVSEKYLIE
ncbi:MAG: hypothetical protein M8357_12500 [Desulfobulbaceae bacterium]|nr:hypothetical protein [Desulfobulbaceae bacterium]